MSTGSVFKHIFLKKPYPSEETLVIGLAMAPAIQESPGVVNAKRGLCEAESLPVRASSSRCLSKSNDTGTWTRCAAVNEQEPHRCLGENRTGVDT